MDANTHGAFPEDNDIALVGRADSDIILKDEEVRVRCGVRRTSGVARTEVSFNKADPTYIKLKYNENSRQYRDPNTKEEQEYKSTATIVADKINLLSHDSTTPFTLTDRKDLVSDDEMKKILEEAHALPYGDKLIEFLDLFRGEYLAHTHPIANLPPCKPDSYLRLVSYDLKQLLSKSIKIN
jgi:hypothetical protein